MNIKDSLMEFFYKNYSEVTVNNFDFDAPFEINGIDSLDVFEIAMHLENEFDITLDDDLIVEAKSINDLIRIANEKINPD